MVAGDTVAGTAHADCRVRGMSAVEATITTTD
jgi:hypothetical protein